MRLFIGGLRGSQPCCGARFEEYGGDTTCLLVVGTQGEYLVLDAGTGMRGVADRLSCLEPGEVTVLFSHYHLDHLAGLMMNPLFYQAGWSFRLVGPTLEKGGVRDVVTHLLAPPYWPVSYQDMPAPLAFAEFGTEAQSVGTLHIRGCPVSHPGGCLAYRIDEAGSNSALVFATDLEWQRQSETDKAAFMSLCREPRSAQLLIVDAHFERSRADAFAGWGHSSWEDGLDVARAAGIPRVLLGHHAPEADDQTLRDLEQTVKQHMPGAALGRAGQWVDV